MLGYNVKKITSTTAPRLLGYQQISIFVRCLEVNRDRAKPLFALIDQTAEVSRASDGDSQ